MQAFAYWQNFIKKETLLIFYHFNCQRKIEIDLIFLGISVARSEGKKKQK
jgi:hypothetical protein